ncbi:MAG TPA: YbaB/EbfC family nucleoid-associated protein [Acidimicrobiia bacterium]|nr:YbaB/EbfC family nucleoid-associated protein [Acidimicrobiia bacterium]
MARPKNRRSNVPQPQPQRGGAQGGMPDMQRLVQQATQMQAEMQQRQAEMAEREFEASSGGGVVTARVKGNGEVLAVTIDPAVLDPDDADLVGDLVVAAVNAAFAEAASAATENLPDLGGLDLGGLGGGLEGLLGG